VEVVRLLLWLLWVLVLAAALVVLGAVAVGSSLLRRSLVLRVVVGTSVLAVDRIYGDERYANTSASRWSGLPPPRPRLDNNSEGCTLVFVDVLIYSFPPLPNTLCWHCVFTLMSLGLGRLSLSGLLFSTLSKPWFLLALFPSKHLISVPFLRYTHKA
jgi:hypothetical protein